MIEKTISDIDKNFKADVITEKDIVFYDCLEKPFVISGLYEPQSTKKYSRLPESFSENNNINEGVRRLLWCTSGGRVRFATDSPYIAIVAEVRTVSKMMHMPQTGQSGFDLYSGEKGSLNQTFKKVFFPADMTEDFHRYLSGFYELDREDDYESRDITINFPLYNGINSLHIGIKEGCKIYPPVPYDIENPVVFYGSSITQGGCASRPGNNYMNHLSRWLKCDFINLGFSGSAKGEQELADYISKLDMSAFVLDYDANAPTLQHLSDTHYKFYETIRNSNKDIPIIMLSMPKYPKVNIKSKYEGRDLIYSNRIILESYLRGIENKDNNLYYVDGETLFGNSDQDACTVDNCHPNDLGFLRMAKAVYPILKKALNS